MVLARLQALIFDARNDSKTISALDTDVTRRLHYYQAAI
jgi:hypothetical protein